MSNIKKIDLSFLTKNVTNEATLTFIASYVKHYTTKQVFGKTTYEKALADMTAAYGNDLTNVISSNGIIKLYLVIDAQIEAAFNSTLGNRFNAIRIVDASNLNEISYEFS